MWTVSRSGLQGVTVTSSPLASTPPSGSPPTRSQGVTVTNSMLLKQGIPVMIPVMWVACFVLIQQEHI